MPLEPEAAISRERTQVPFGGGSYATSPSSSLRSTVLFQYGDPPSYEDREARRGGAPSFEDREARRAGGCVASSTLLT